MKTDQLKVTTIRVDPDQWDFFQHVFGRKWGFYQLVMSQLFSALIQRLQSENLTSFQLHNESTFQPILDSILASIRRDGVA